MRKGEFQTARGAEEIKRRFNRILLESLLENLDFGEVIIHFLELNTSVKRNEIAEKPELFAEHFEDLMGDTAKIILEKTVKKE